MSKGFTLIEFALALLISSFLAALLFRSFSSLNMSMQVAEDIMDLDTRLAIVSNQLEKDISGAFIPRPIKEEKKEGQKTSQEAQYIEKAFYGSEKNKSLDILTFISNNPLRVYENAKNVTPKPSIVRIAYRLKEDKNKKNTYNLLRQESINLDFATFDPKKPKAPRGYALLDNIKKLSVQFVYPVLQEDKKKKVKTIKEFKEKSSWLFPDKKKDAKKQVLPLPFAIRFNLVLWDNKKQEERSFDLTFPIVAFSIEPEKKEEKKEEQQKRKPVKQVLEEELKKILQKNEQKNK